MGKNKQREAIAAYGFVLPTFIGYIAFVIGPIIAAIWLSFTKYDIFTPAEAVGFGNYIEMWGDSRLRTVYLNTLYFTVAAVFLNISAGVGLAVLVNRRMPDFVAYIYRLAFFFPVLVAIIWQILYSKDTGIINYYLNFLGVPDISWLGNKKTAMPAIIVMDVWKNTGFAMIIIAMGIMFIELKLLEKLTVPDDDEEMGSTLLGGRRTAPA